MIDTRDIERLMLGHYTVPQILPGQDPVHPLLFAHDLAIWERSGK